jgi:hypothetical protein
MSYVKRTICLLLGHRDIGVKYRYSSLIGTKKSPWIFMCGRCGGDFREEL